MTNNGVATGQNEHFPLMYHWRLLPCEQDELNINYWENSPAIRQRVEALNQATTCIAVFLEYIPKNLHQYLQDEMAIGEHHAEKALTWIDRDLKDINEFMLKQNLIHFDAHFNNILTDGKKLYLTDFGLALSSMFELSEIEMNFFKLHQTYDNACASVNLLRSIIGNLFDRENWITKLQEYLQGKLDITSPQIATIIKKHAGVAMIMDEFFQKLQKVSKSTPYPAIQLEVISKKR